MVAQTVKFKNHNRITLYSRKTGCFGSAGLFAFIGVPAVDTSVAFQPTKA